MYAEEYLKKIIKDEGYIDLRTSKELPKEWAKVKIILFNAERNEYYFDQEAVMKNSVLKRPRMNPEGEIIAWKYLW